MKYVCLIYVPEDLQDMPERNPEVAASFYSFTKDVIARGLRVASGRLADATLATTVRVRDGQRLLSDGPFAEAKEVLAGFYVLECSELDEALEQAARIPSSAYGAIEVRPLVEL
jgi:hypothetical protein